MALPHQLKTLESRLEASARALAGAGVDLRITIQGQHVPSVLERHSHYFLPPPDNVESTVSLYGYVDQLGLARKYHDENLHRRHAAGEETTRHIYDTLEITRIALHGTRYMHGAWHNIYRQWLQQDEQQGYAHLLQDEAPPWAKILQFLLIRDVMGMEPPPALRPYFSKWEGCIRKVSGGILSQLAGSLDNQLEFYQQLQALLQALSSLEAWQGTVPELSEMHPSEPVEAEGADAQEDLPSDVNIPSADEVETMPAAADEVVSGAQDVQIEEGGLKEMHAGVMVADMLEPPPASIPVIEAPAPYAAYTTEHDEVIAAGQLVSDEEMVRLRAVLDEKMQGVDTTFTRLSAQLQRLLIARQQRRWQFNEEEGVLHSGRLAGMIANPANTTIFKQEQDTDFQDTVVTMLLDNSGSMRGRPITITALATDILARVLERAGVKVEILGFTTREWKGGASHKAWVQAGKPALPGRLNDLRHIIYKSADMPYLRARKQLAVMLKEGLLKENIDGEALLWAYERLQQRREARRILLVISDGAPVDDATLSANRPGYLDRHLREVINRIESDHATELTAIGIGHDVTRYYRQSVCLKDVTRLGETMTRELVTLFGG